jgi:viologen exporter family transport system ATP-binding protein
MAPIVVCSHVSKEYRTPKRQTGLLGGLRTLFTRQYEVKRAVDDVSFSLEEGELLGYIGPNGAGKSTTIKMLTGILTPTSGTLEVAGLTPWRQRERNALNIGVVFGQRSQLWWDLPLIESFKLVAKMYRVEPERYKRNLAHFRELLELDEFMTTPVRQLSLGQRMRGDLAAALLHDPEILYLDEPTIGLDVVAKQRIRDFLRRLNQERGLTVLLTTHDMTDIAQLCQRMLIIDHGRLLYDGALAAIRDRFGVERTLVVDLAEDEVLDGPLSVGPAVQMRADGPRRWLRFRRDDITAAELIAAVSARYRIRDLTIEEPEIEAIVRRLYEEGL